MAEVGRVLGNIDPRNSLQDIRHELFCAEIIRGSSVKLAFELSFPESKANNFARAGGIILARPDVKARIEYLRTQISRRTQVTASKIIERLMSIADQAEAESLTEGTKALAVSRAALMDVAKIAGLVVQRIEGKVSVVQSLEGMNSEDLKDLLLSVREHKAIRVDGLVSASGSALALDAQSRDDEVIDEA
jgi:hypothetical protein